MPSQFSHPFRLADDGSIAKVDDSSDQYVAEQLAMLVLTKPGERPLVPDLGVADPTFVGFESGTLQEQVDAFGPPCVIDSVEVLATGPSTQQVAVSFTVPSDEQEVEL